MTETNTWSTPNIETCLRKQAPIDGSLYFVMLEWLSISLLYHRITIFQHGINRIGSDHRTLEPLDYFFGLFFLDYFWTIQFGPSTGPIFGPFFSTILSEGRQTIGMQSISTQEGVGGKLLLIQIIRAVFRKTFFFTSNCLRWTAAFLYIFGMRMRNWHLNTGNNCYCYKNIVGTIVRSDLLSFLIHSLPLVECHVTHFTS